MRMATAGRKNGEGVKSSKTPFPLHPLSFSTRTYVIYNTHTHTYV